MVSRRRLQVQSRAGRDEAVVTVLYLFYSSCCCYFVSFLLFFFLDRNTKQVLPVETLSETRIAVPNARPTLDSETGGKARDRTLCNRGLHSVNDQDTV
ncbi:unnamed protein product [Gadus morhua 'NCC']